MPLAPAQGQHHRPHTSPRPDEKYWAMRSHRIKGTRERTVQACGTFFSLWNTLVMVQRFWIKSAAEEVTHRSCQEPNGDGVFIDTPPFPDNDQQQWCGNNRQGWSTKEKPSLFLPLPPGCLESLSGEGAARSHRSPQRPLTPVPLSNYVAFSGVMDGSSSLHPVIWFIARWQYLHFSAVISLRLFKLLRHLPPFAIHYTPSDVTISFLSHMQSITGDWQKSWRFKDNRDRPVLWLWLSRQ